MTFRPLMRGATISRVSISLPSDLLQEFDQLISEMQYDRSKAIQAAMRLFLTEQKDLRQRKGSLLGAIAVTYDHDVRGLEKRLTDIQHSFSTIVRGAMHIHLDQTKCLQIIAVKGSAKHVRHLVQELMAQRGVKQLRPAMVRG